MSLLYIFASNSSAAQMWARRNGIAWKQCRYIQGVRSLKGIGSFVFVHVPSAYSRPDYRELREILNYKVRIHGAVELDTFDALDKWLKEQRKEAGANK
jgi:hypothetical protein